MMDDSPTDCEGDIDAESSSDPAGNSSQNEHTKRHRSSPYGNLQSKKRRTRDFAHVKSPIQLTPDHSKTFKSGSRPSRRFKLTFTLINRRRFNDVRVAVIFETRTNTFHLNRYGILDFNSIIL